MSDKPAISIQPQAELVCVAVHDAALKDATLDELHRALASAAEKHPNLPIVLDLTPVNYVPSMALGTLVMFMRQLKDTSQRFVLVGLQPEVRTVLAITRLDKLFEIKTDLEAAAKHLHATNPTHQK
jgi:anti-sigma B factor antagonist